MNEQACFVSWLVYCFFHGLVFSKSTRFKLKQPPGVSKIFLASVISMLPQKEWN